MKKRITTLALALMAVVGAHGSVDAAEGHLPKLMPKPQDFTSMWWVGGFPAKVEGAPWHRGIQTGNYAMVLDTETLKIPHFGPIGTGSGDEAWQDLEPATLELNLTVDGVDYHCSGGGKWTRFTGPRLIESGRFMQRADVTDLVFLSDDGKSLAVEARFETAAWPDRLALIFAARPRRDTGAEATGKAPSWTNARMEIKLSSAKGALQLKNLWDLPQGKPWKASGWEQVSLALDPVKFELCDSGSPVSVAATEIPDGAQRPVQYDSAIGWHRVNLDGVDPIPPPGGKGPSNDALERVKLVLTNPTDHEQIARLMFDKSSKGFRQRMGSSVTGISACLRDSDGNPTGIPVQLSKNWHNDPKGGVYSGAWFHGISQLRLPAGSTVNLELTISYGHWGGVPAASHAQLSLIGWGSNQLWHQSALGAWGESICYEPDQVQAACTITDVRPSMLSPSGSNKRWSWTSNIGGGDFFRLFDKKGKRVPHSSMRTTDHAQGPCLTEVTYAGRVGAGIRQSMSVSLARTDDIVRGIYQIRMDVDKPVDFSRFVIFQIGADTYNSTKERAMAIGNEDGLLKEWDTEWGGNTYRTSPLELRGKMPWASLHKVEPHENDKLGTRANRGFVIRKWKARLGGKDASPWVAEHGLVLHRRDSSTLDLVPPPGIERLEPGDFIEATIEHLVMPADAEDYYGPSKTLRAALEKDGNTWRMIQREALGNRRQVSLSKGTLERYHPDIRIRTHGDGAAFELTGGIGYVPLTFTDLSSPSGYSLLVDGKELDQSVHGNDFWQAGYDPATRRWSHTYNIKLETGSTCAVELVR